MKSPHARVLFLLSLATAVILTSGNVIRRPTGKCPLVVKGIHCVNYPENECENDGDCSWNYMCCFNGCVKLCMRVSEGSSPPRSTKSPFHKPPFYYPPHNPLPIPPQPCHPPNKPPIPVPIPPDLPPLWVPPPEIPFPEEPFPDDIPYNFP